MRGVECRFLKVEKPTNPPWIAVARCALLDFVSPDFSAVEVVSRDHSLCVELNATEFRHRAQENESPVGQGRDARVKIFAVKTNRSCPQLITLRVGPEGWLRTRQVASLYRSERGHRQHSAQSTSLNVQVSRDSESGRSFRGLPGW